jgi:putative endonuclease
VYYVYLIESISAQGKRYLGMTTDLKERLQEHNAGKSSHSAKFKPWKMTTYIAFTDSEGRSFRALSQIRFGPRIRS